MLKVEGPGPGAGKLTGLVEITAVGGEVEGIDCLKILAFRTRFPMREKALGNFMIT